MNAVGARIVGLTADDPGVSDDELTARVEGDLAAAERVAGDTGLRAPGLDPSVDVHVAASGDDDVPGAGLGAVGQDLGARLHQDVAGRRRGAAAVGVAEPSVDGDVAAAARRITEAGSVAGDGSALGAVPVQGHVAGGVDRDRAPEGIRDVAGYAVAEIGTRRGVDDQAATTGAVMVGDVQGQPAGRRARAGGRRDLACGTDVQCVPDGHRPVLDDGRVEVALIVDCVVGDRSVPGRITGIAIGRFVVRRRRCTLGQQGDQEGGEDRKAKSNA